MSKESAQFNKGKVRRDHQVIADIITFGSRVLDLGCGNGDLLSLLIDKKGVDGQGIEVDVQAIYECVSRGLSVSHQDIDCGLSEYGSKSFDYVILNQTLQQVVKLENVLKETMRVGRKVIIGFPNFVYYQDRFQFFFKGKTPVTPALPYLWYDTPNLHFLSIADFMDYCRKQNFQIEKGVFLSGERIIKIFPNFFAQVAIFLLDSSK